MTEFIKMIICGIISGAIAFVVTMLVECIFNYVKKW
jgi:hypothetical protein